MESLKKTLSSSNNISTIRKISESIESKDIKVTWYGSVRLKHRDFKDTICINDILKSAYKQKIDSSNKEELKRIVSIVKHLDKKAKKKLDSSNWLAKKLHFIPHLLGNLFFNRTVVIKYFNSLLSQNSEKENEKKDPPLKTADPNLTSQPKKIAPPSKQELKVAPLKTTSPEAADASFDLNRPDKPLEELSPLKQAEVPILEDKEEVYSHEDEEFGFDFELDDKVLSRLFNKSIVLHIHGNKFGDTSPLQGSCSRECLLLLKEYLNLQRIHNKCDRFDKLIQKIQDSLEILDSETYQKKLKIAFEENRPLLVQGGWTGMPMGHSMYYEVIPTSNTTANFRVFNLGAGVEFHYNEHTSTKTKYAPYFEFKDVAYEKLIEPDFFRAIEEMTQKASLSSASHIKTEYDADDIYLGFEKLLNTNEEQKKASFFESRVMSAQESGICAFRSLLAFLSTQMTKTEYKKLKCDLKIKSLLTLTKEQRYTDAEGVNLIQKSLKRTSKTVHDLAANKVLSAEYVKKAHFALTQVNNKLESFRLAQSRSKQSKSVSKEIPKLIRSFKIHSLFERCTAEKPVASIDLNFDYLQEINRIKTNENKFEAIRLVADLSKKAWNDGEYFALQTGLANFFSELPNDLNYWKMQIPEGHEKEAIINLGNLSELYFKSSFFSSHGAVSDERHLVITKTTLLLEHFSKVLFPELNFEFPTTPPSHFGSYVHEIATTAYQSRGYKHPSYLNCLEVVLRPRALDDNVSNSRKFKFEKGKEKSFRELFYLDEACLKAFEAKVQGKVLSFSDYVKFYFSDEIPDWLKVIRNNFFANDLIHNSIISNIRGTKNLDFSFEVEDDPAGLGDAQLTVQLKGGDFAEAPKTAVSELNAGRHERYLLMLRAPETPSIKALFKHLLSGRKINQEEKDWLTTNLTQIKMIEEEFFDLRPLFSNETSQTLESLSYFSKHPEKFKELDYQTIFQIAFFNPDLSADLKKNQEYGKIARDLLSQNFYHMFHATEVQSAVFLLQMLRYLNRFSPVSEGIDRLEKLKKLLDFKELSIEDKSVIYAEITAHLGEKKELNSDELELMLTGIAYLERFPVPLNLRDPYLEEDILKAAHNHADAIKKFVQEEKFCKESINRIVNILYPQVPPLFFDWKLSDDHSLPMFQSGKSAYYPFQGLLFLDLHQEVNRPLPAIIKEHPEFIKAFPVVSNSRQLTPFIYAFNDSQGVETLVSYDYVKKELSIEKQFEDNWITHVPEKDLLIQKEREILSLLSSRFIIQNYTAWTYPAEGSLKLTNPKTGEIEYVCKNLGNQLVVLRVKDNLTLKTPSSLLMHFEHSSYIHEWYEAGELKELELPRFGLTFKRDPKHQNRFYCEQVNGFYLNLDEKLEDFKNFSAYLILENEAGEKKVIVREQGFLTPAKYNPLIPDYISNWELEIQDRQNQKYYIYDIEDDLLQSSSREANLYLVEIYNLVQSYELAGKYIRNHGLKLSPYSEKENEILKRITSSREITGDNDPNNRAVVIYSYYLLLKNAALKNQTLDSSLLNVAHREFSSYLSALRGISSITLTKYEEIFLLKTFLDKAFDPVLYLRLKELDPEGLKAKETPKKWNYKEEKPAYSFQIIKAPLPWGHKFAKRPDIDNVLLTRLNLELTQNFYGFYELARTADAKERKWLEHAFIFNRLSKQPQLGNLLEIVLKFPEEFGPLPELNSKCQDYSEIMMSWKHDLDARFQKILEENPDQFKDASLQVIEKIPVLKSKTGQKLIQKQLSVDFDIAFENVPYNEKAKDFFEGHVETKDETTNNRIQKKLASWKTKDTALNSEIDIKIKDCEAYKNRDPRITYELKASLEEIENLLAADGNSQEELQKLKDEILLLANKKPKEEDQCIQYELELLAGIKKELTLDDLLIVNFGRQEPEHLIALNPALDLDDISALYGKVGKYLSLATYEQQRVRCQKTVQELKDLPKESDPLERKELIQKLANDLLAKRNFDPKQQPIHLLFEYFLDISIRKDQIDKIIQFGKIPKALMQMIMGSGKTTVLLQLISYLNADSENLSIMIVPKPLFADVATYSQKEHQRIFGKKLHTFHFDRNTPVDKLSLENILDDLKGAKENRECLILTSKSVACLILKYLEKSIFGVSSPSEREELELMEKILKILSSRGSPLLDEIDTLLNVLHEISFSVGSLLQVEESEYVTIAELYKIIYEDLEIKKLAYAESDPKPNKEAPVMTADLYHKKIKGALAKAFIERLNDLEFESAVLQKELRVLVDSLKEKEKKDLLHAYLCQDKKQIKSAQAFYDGLSPNIKNVIALAGEEISRFLPYTLNINYNEKYGFDQKGQKFAIPYSAANSPNKGSDFKNSHITMNTTFQMYVKCGIPESCIKNILDGLKQKALLELKEDSSLDIERTKAWKIFCKIKGDLDIPFFKQNQAQLDLLRDFINKDLGSKFNFIIYGILPELKRYSATLSFNPQNLVSFFEKPAGFSGSFWNLFTMHGKFTPLMEPGTDAKTINILYEKSQHAVRVVEASSPEMMLEEIGLDFDMMIDLGGYFKELGSAKAAKLIANKSKTKTFFVSKSGARKTTDGNQKEFNYKKFERGRKHFVDQSRTTGLDVKLAPTAKGVLTIGRNITVRDLVQGAWRMRDLDKGQTLSFCISKEVASMIRDVCQKPEGEILFEDILHFAICNQAKQLGGDYFKALKQQFWDVPQMLLLKTVIDKKLPLSELHKAKELLKQAWVASSNLTPDELYGKLAKNKKSSKVVAAEKEKCTKFIERCLKALPSLQNEGLSSDTILEELNKIEKRLISLLPPKLKSKNLDEDQSVEVETEQEQEIEVESQEQRESLRVSLGKKRINSLKRIVDLNDQTEQRNYLSLELFFQSNPDLKDYSKAFDGIDMTINVLQYDRMPTSDYYEANAQVPVEQLKFFGPYRTPLLHIGVRKDNSLILFSRQEIKRNFDNFDGYNLTLGSLNGTAINPEVLEKIVKVKFLNGESTYRKEELEILKNWLLKEGVLKMRKLFIKHILKGFPKKMAAYNDSSDLKNLFRDLTKN